MTSLASSPWTIPAIWTYSSFENNSLAKELYEKLFDKFYGATNNDIQNFSRCLFHIMPNTTFLSLL